MNFKQTFNAFLACCAGVVSFASISSSACEIEGGLTTLSPANWVTITDTLWDARNEGDYLYVFLRIEDEEQLVPAWADGQAGFKFMVPASLVSPWQSVSIDELWLSDGEDELCRVRGDLKRGALARQDGVTQAIMLGSVLEIESMLRGHGINPETRTYYETGEPADRELVRPLVMAKRDYRSFDTMLTQAQQNPELAELISVIDAYIAQSGVADTVLETAQQEIDLNELFEENYQKDAHMFGGAHVWRAQNSALKSPAAKTGKYIMTSRAPKNAEQLSEMLKAQYDSALNGDPMAGFYRDMSGTLLGISGSLFTASGFKPGAVAMNGMAQKLFMEAMYHKIRDGLYPGELFKFEIEGGSYYLSTKRSPNSGQITALNVTPSAKGVNVAGLVADAVLNFLPFAGKARVARVGLAKKLGREMVEDVVEDAAKRTVKQRIKKASADQIRNLKSFANGDKVSTSNPELLGWLDTMFDGMAKSALALVSGNSEYGKIAVIDPFDYDPVNILEPGYYVAHRDETKFLNWETQDKLIKYSAKDPGKTTVTFSTMPGKFADDHIEKKQIIQTQDPAILVSPDRYIIMPGDVVRYEATVVGVDIMEVKQRDLNVATPAGFNASLVTRQLESEIETDVYDVSTSKSVSSYPARIAFEANHYDGLRTVREIALPEISPSVSCVPHETSIEFQALDHNDVPIASATWDKEGPGTLSGKGIYTAPSEGRGEVKVQLLSPSGELVDETSFTLGCSCEWSAQIGSSQNASGKMISVSSIGVGEVPALNVMTMDGEEAVIAFTAEGDVNRWEEGAVTLQFGERNYVAGVGIYTDPRDKCIMPETRVSHWDIAGERWLQGGLYGEAMDISTVANGCPTLHPFKFSFTADLTGNDLTSMDGIMEMMRGKELSGIDSDTADLLAGISGMGLNISACFTDED